MKRPTFYVIALLWLTLIQPSYGARSKKSSSKPKTKPATSLVLIGNIPAFYYEDHNIAELEKNNTANLGRRSDYALSWLIIVDGVIYSYEWIEWDKEGKTEKEAGQALEEKLAAIHEKVKEEYGYPVLELRPVSNRLARPEDFDVIYPGLVDLHNHTKQNVLPLWPEALGQFENRWEWRAWSVYKNRGSFNMNPWISYGSAVTCASFRWSELQAMTLGTTYLQGPSNTGCVQNFAIHRVEDATAFRAETDYVEQFGSIQAPTDTVLPKEMHFLWHVLKPMIGPKTYEEALLEVVEDYCPTLKGTIQDINSKEARAMLENKALMKKICTIPKGVSPKAKTPADKKKLVNDPYNFIRHVTWLHKNAAGKKNYLLNDETSGPVITHLAEGRRKDPINNIEFKLLETMGLAIPYMNLIHVVGLDTPEYKIMGQNRMGAVISALSNFVLYGETARIMAAHRAGVVMGIGSDWTPTGTKSSLEEVKILRNFVQKDPFRKERLEKNPKDPGLAKVFTDEYLFNMMTENAAFLMNHYESDPEDGYHGMGTLVPDSMGTVVITKRNHKNAFTNLVLSEAKDINLVIVDGFPTYGEVPYIQAWGGFGGNKVWELESLPKYYSGLNELPKKRKELGIPAPPFEGDAKAKQAHLEALAKHPALKTLAHENRCGFSKAYVVHPSGNKSLNEFKKATGLDLDRPSDIQKLLGINLMTQNYNLNPYQKKTIVTDPKTGKKKVKKGSSYGVPGYEVKTFPALFTCNDKHYEKLIKNFIDPRHDFKDDTFSKNLSLRQKRRDDQGHTKADRPGWLAKEYGLGPAM